MWSNISNLVENASSSVSQLAAKVESDLNQSVGTSHETGTEPPSLPPSRPPFQPTSQPSSQPTSHPAPPSQSSSLSPSLSPSTPNVPIPLPPPPASSQSSELSQLRLEGASLALKVSTLSTALKSKSKLLTLAEGQLEDALLRIETTDSEVKGEEEVVGGLEEEVKGLKESVVALEVARIDDEARHKAALTQETATQNAQFKAVQAECDVLKDELSSVRGGIRKEEGAVARERDLLRAEYSREKGRLVAMQKPNTDRIAALTKELMEKTNELSRVTQSFEERSSNQAEMGKMYERLLKESKAKGVEREEEVRALRREIEKESSARAADSTQHNASLAAHQLASYSLNASIASLTTQSAALKTKQAKALTNLTEVHEGTLATVKTELAAANEQAAALRSALPKTPAPKATEPPPRDLFLSPTATSGGLGFAQVEKFNSTIKQREEEIAFLKAQVAAKDSTILTSGTALKETQSELDDLKQDFEDERMMRRGEVQRLASIVAGVGGGGASAEERKEAEVIQSTQVDVVEVVGGGGKVEYDASDYENFMV